MQQDTKEIVLPTKQDKLTSDKMRNTSIGKLLLQMSLPAIFSMLVQSLYNIVDSLFLTNITNVPQGYVGNNIGVDSFNAVSVVYPMTMFVLAVAIGIGVGANAYIARKLGEGNREKATQASKTAIVMAIVAWLVMVILGFTISKPFVKVFVNADNATDINYVVNQGSMYLTIFMVGSIGLMIDVVCARILQATGNMKVPMISQVAGALTNIFLDWLFIIPLKMGVLGAIVATVIGQWVAAGIDLAVFLFKKQDVSIALNKFSNTSHYVKQIARIGMPAFIMNAMSSVTTIIMNILLRKYVNGITVLSAYFKVQSFIFMPVFGLMQGAMPILSYNYGACLKKRFNQTFVKGLTVALAVMTVGTLLFQFLPEQLMAIFKSQPAEGVDLAQLESANALLIKEGAYAFRAISIAFIPAAFAILMINMQQSLNSGLSSLLMSLSRQLLFLIPSAILFNYWWGQEGIWYCYPFAEIMSLVIYTPFAVRCYKRRFAYKQAQYDNNLLKNAN